jgi:CubicO group peptidase (beta-lactamase class C family)
MRFIFFILLIYPTVLPSQDIHAYFQEMSRLNQHNGNFLLAENGQRVIDFSSGFADFVSNRKNKENARFNLASISKVITATAVLQLRDKQKIKLDNAVIKYLPAFPFKDVTVRHLLTHTSGLPDLELFEDLVKQFPDTVLTNRDVIPELRRWKRGLYFKPGDQFRYCNTEYNLLALLVEKAGGMPFETYLGKHIFQPAGMTGTYLAKGADHPDSRLVSLPQLKRHPGYDSSFVPADSISRFRYLTYNNSGTVGQGSIISTTADLLRFDQAYFGGQLLTAASMEEAMTPIRLNSGEIYTSDRMDTMEGEGKMFYGLGWEIFQQAAFGKSVGHGGFKFGLATFYFHNLAKNQTIIAFDNTAGSEFGRFIFSSLCLLNNKPALPFRTSRSLVKLYGTALVKNGADHAAVLFNACKGDTLNYYLNEGEMNDLGYDLFYMSDMPGHKELALEVFKLATFIFPLSFNTYDSYAQLLRDSGRKKDAIAMYKKSLELNPKNHDGQRILNQLLESPDQK